ncbi:MAG: hypothetical protein IDH49_04210 [Gammaproteobacteria bacterium]|nr:hypothetical protein [Gammaproteobacteria bacterium]
MDSVMFDFLLEVTVISFAFGGVVGAVVALSFQPKKKIAEETTKQEAEDVV